MEEFKFEEVQACAAMLSEAVDPSDAFFAWSILQKKHPDLRALVSLDLTEQQAVPPAIKKYTKQPLNYLVPYFSSENIYFLGDELLENMFSSGEVRFGIDYSLMLDTNIATYINKIIRGESLGNMQTKVVTLIDEILRDNLNFDHMFYMVENVKNIIHILSEESPTKIEFWRSLNKGFRNNMVSLQLFRSIDCIEYKSTLNPTPTFTYREAARSAIDFSYDFYVSEIGKEHLSNFVLVQRMILLQLIGMVKIQLSSNKSAKNKMAEYTSYVHNVVGAYFDRESIIAHKYFNDRKCLGILNKIQKGGSKVRLLKRLDNIAWDMAAPRFMEKLISTVSEGGEGKYFIPLFVSFDSKLREMLRLFPIKGVIYNRNSGDLIPLPEINSQQYFEEHGCSEQLEYLFNHSVKSERMSRPKPTRQSIHKLIKKEFYGLRELVSLGN